MITARTFAGNIVVQITGRIIAVLIGLASVAILTRYLTTESFGEYTTVMTYLQFFGVLVDFGLTLTFVVMISKKGADEEKVAGNFLSLRLITGAIVFAVAPMLVLFFPWSATIKQAVTVGAIAYWMMGGATLLVGIFQKHASMWRAALAEMINRTVLVSVIVLFAFMNLGVVAMVGASIVANAIWLLVMIFYAKPFVRIMPRIDLDVWKEAFTKSWPIALSIFFNLLYLKGDIIFLSLLRTQTEVAIYGVTYRILDVLTALPTMFMGLLLPTLVAAWTSGDKEKFKLFLSRGFDVFMIAVIPIVVGAQVVATPLMVLIAGEQYAASGPVLQYLIFAVFGVFLGAFYGHTIVAINKQRSMIIAYALIAVTSVIGYFWFIPLYGMWGAVAVTIYSEAMIALITFAVVSKVTGLLPRLVVTGKAIAASGVMYLFLISFPSFHVLTDVLLGALVYLAVMIVIKGVRASEIKLLLPDRFLPKA